MRPLTLLRRYCSSGSQARTTIRQDDEVKVIKRFTQSELDSFSQLTGDHNPIHSVGVPAEQRKVHGAFLNAVVGGIIGTKLPGPGTIVVELRQQFHKPCRIETDTHIRVSLVHKRKLAFVFYECQQNNETIFSGEAKVVIPTPSDSKNNIDK